MLVQHLAPERESALAEIFSRATSMPVTEVTDRQALEPNRVYVIPPGQDLVLDHGHLLLQPRGVQRVQHPIDFFFRSLAANLRHRAIGVVLSGTATDGTIGMEEIKAEGGFTFAQDETAMYPGMPRSAIASGCVDQVLAPAAIAAEIARIAAQPYVAENPAAEEARPADDGADQAVEGLEPSLQILHRATGVDFTEYKRSTLLRRIQRRMVLRQNAGLADYAKSLGKDAAEVEALYQDILINVTSFFRDPEVFEELAETVLPALFKDRAAADPIRVWVVACSTGEEAYSLAILLSELKESLKCPSAIQIFATDINDGVIMQARAGVYSQERLRDMSATRIARFFTEQNGEYRVSKSLREMCRFSRHNVMSDPPLSRMDLVSCRNLLIYIGKQPQLRLIPILHYALKPSGVLVLGASETVGPLGNLFARENGRCKIYRRRSTGTRVPLQLGLRVRSAAPVAADQAAPPSSSAIPGVPATMLSGIVRAHLETDRLLAALAPPSVLVDENLTILEFRGDIEPYLTPAQGMASHGLLKMARAGLAMPLRTLLHRASKTRAPVSEMGVRFRSTNGDRVVDLDGIPVQGRTANERCCLVLFREPAAQKVTRPAAAGKSTRPKRGPVGDAPESSAAGIARLERELASSRGYLQALVEQHEAANEALQAANEEAQSANEEFQSINEELETTKEEIQSSNEELTTINDELSNRNQELAKLGSDLANVINSVQVAIVILGLDLRIQRINPQAMSLLNLIPSDIGRPLADIRTKLVYPGLLTLLGEVIGTTSVKEIEVQAVSGRWYSLRIHPYLAAGDKIDGAVLSLIDITASYRARTYVESIVATVREPLLVLDKDFRVRTASHSYCTYFGVARAEVEGLSLFEVANRQWDVAELRLLLQDVLSHESVVQDFAIKLDVKDLGPRALLVNFRTLLDPVEQHPAILFSIEDVTLRQKLAEVQSERNAELAANDAAKNQFLAVLSHELRTPLTVMRLWSHIMMGHNVDAKTLRNGLECIDRSSKWASRLVGDLLDVHRISSGKLHLERIPLDLAALAHSVLDAMKPGAEEKEIRLLREIDSASIAVSGDFQRLQQVIGNVLGNAIKFTPRGGEIRFALRRDGPSAVMQVSDTGEGFAPGESASLFVGFRPADPLTIRPHGGLGLGLAISKQLVEQHGGSITAASPGKGRGATFTISLPLLAVKPPALLPPPKQRTSKKPASLKGITVLVVDDEADAREALRWLLEQAGARAIVTGSVTEALAAFQKRRPDVILSDIGLPERSGYDLVRTIRALSPAEGGMVPAIALTAFAAPEDRALAKSAGFEKHLAKPIDPEKILAAIVAVVARKRPPAAKRKGKR